MSIYQTGSALGQAAMRRRTIFKVVVGLAIVSALVTLVKLGVDRVRQASARTSSI